MPHLLYSKENLEFKSLPISSSYYTTSSDIAEEFYTPVLEFATSYDRVSGYFSSKALALYAKGLRGLIKNSGKMRLIISQEISEADFDLIKSGYDLREKLQTLLFSKLNDKLNIEEQIDFYNLAHLIAIGNVDIKIGFKKNGIFHSKFGLFEDIARNIIYFTGSNNETKAAIENNFESFGVTTTWLSSDFDQQKIWIAREEFNKLWTNSSKEQQIYVEEINDIIKQKIMTYDKGRIILNPENLTQDALILSIEDDQLFLQDTLISYEIKTNDFALKKLAPYFTDSYPNFKNTITYIEIKEIIKILERFSDKKNFNFIVTSELVNFLEQQAYWIEERSKYALLLKSQDSRISDRFNTFKQIVSNELYRPLREKQMQSAFYMQQMKKSANFSVPGAGKTSMVYGVFAYLNSSEINAVDQIIMVGPKNSFLSWKLEFNENFGDKKELKLLNIHDENAPIVQLELNSNDKNLILINYESLQKYEKILCNIINERTMLVFDEVHKIKGVTSKRAQVAKKIAEKPLYKYVLTGTPIPNTYEDIFNFLNILYTDEYKKFFNFKISELKKPDLLKIEKINNKLFPFFWRTTKKELGVPDANPDSLIPIEATLHEQHIIDLLYKKYAGNPLHLYIRLIQASTNPELILKAINKIEMYGEDNKTDWFKKLEKDPITFTEDELQTIRQVKTTSKFQASIDLTMDLNTQGKQTLIWCIFVSTIDKVYAELKKRDENIRVAIIYGNTPQNERETIIEAFKRKEIDILITNPHTLAESVSLHRKCHDAIYLEYSFNLTHMLQSRDRIHRLGLEQTDYTQYYYFMLEGKEFGNNTVDQRIYDRLKEKEQRMLDAIEGGSLMPDPEVDYTEILDLFA